MLLKTKAEDLIKAGADIDFQAADTYPMQCTENKLSRNKWIRKINTVFTMGY